MIVVVAPEPAPWVGPVIQAALRVGSVEVFAPWAVPTSLAELVPERLRSGLARRTLDLAPTRTLPGWIAVEAASRLWSRGLTDRQMVARFALRSGVDALAARWLSPRCEAVIAPSLAARRVFAKAARWGSPTMLVEDLPSLRAMHLDLDAAAAHHPQATFLRRFRASPGAVAEQEAERVLASHVLLRSRFARGHHDGRPVETLLDLPLPTPVPSPRAAARSGPARLLLAGVAAARHGTFEALAALARRPDELLVRVGEGTEPADLIRRAGVRASTREEREALLGVDLVLAPSWCESHAPEVALAAAAGVPIVATRRGAGLVDLARAGVEVQPGDVYGLTAAVERALSMAPDPQPTIDAGVALSACLEALLRPKAPPTKRVVRLPVVT